MNKRKIMASIIPEFGKRACARDRLYRASRTRVESRESHTHTIFRNFFSVLHFWWWRITKTGSRARAANSETNTKQTESLLYALACAWVTKTKNKYINAKSIEIPNNPKAQTPAQQWMLNFTKFRVEYYDNSGNDGIACAGVRRLGNDMARCGRLF